MREQFNTSWQISLTIYRLVRYLHRYRVCILFISKRKEEKGKRREREKKKTISRQYDRRACEKEIDMHTAQINYSRGIITFAERRNIFHRANFHRDSIPLTEQVSIA